MLYALIALDKPGALPIRQENRAAHLAYIDATGCVAQAGPFLNDAGEMVGSLIILDLPDMAAAEAWAAGDPYGKAGLFDSVTIRPWKRVIG
ncbi:YciI family protein [Palleronia sp. KMU-117]|uniref:YciI family protein n=1 Tax=Palleronia sp. KMU-117 TaxID=3434108 RepID=UPI003D7665AB